MVQSKKRQMKIRQKPEIGGDHEEYLREQRRSSIVAAAVTILLGLMLCLVPNGPSGFCAVCLGTA